MSYAGGGGAIQRMRAMTSRDLAVQVSYHFQLVLWFAGALTTAFIAYYVSQLVGEPAQLSAYEGSYFDYALVGLALTSYAGLGVSAFSTQISQEQSAGTLEILLAGPSRLGVILAGGFVMPLVMTTLEVALVLGIGVGVIGVGLTLHEVVLAIPVVVLTVLNFCALGIVSAAVILLTKRGDPVSRPLYQVTLLTSGAIFPVDLFPAWLQTLCHLNPAFYGVTALRAVLLADADLGDITGDLGVLAGFAAVGLPVAIWLFSRAVQQAKYLGVLAAF